MKKRFLLMLTMLIVALFAFGGCGGGGGGGDGPVPPPPPPPPPPVDAAVFEPGEDSWLDTKTAVAGEDTVLEIDGAKVVFPAGAVPAGTVLKLGYNNGTLDPKSGTYSGKTIALDASPIKGFERPVSITLPFSGDEDDVPVPYYADANGVLQAAQVTNIGTPPGTFTFETFHASWFPTIIESVSAILDNTVTASTGYSPMSDGFQIVNYGSGYNPTGECLGMTSFSLWYFSEKKSAGDFFPKYMAPVEEGSSLTGQDVIATRSFISITQRWDYLSEIVTREMEFGAAKRFVSIHNAVKNTGRPVLIYLWDNTEHNSAHSVLAYKSDVAGGSAVLSIYDPNYPNTIQQMSFANGAFLPYDGYKGIVFNGDGSFQVREAYSSILADADRNFHGSDSAVITISSHTNGETIADERDATLRGTVDFVEVVATKIEVVVRMEKDNSTAKFSAEIKGDGTFELPVMLDRGKNTLQFALYGPSANGIPMPVSHSMTENFILNCDVGQSVMLVTLTWNTGGTDIDLYVTDPTGATSWFSNRRTPDGGELDRDDTNGYGPEHWTLYTTNTVRWGEEYKVNVQYYAPRWTEDNPSPPTNWTVRVKMYEGTDRSYERVYYGSLRYGNSSESGPGGSGSSWNYVCTMIPEEE